MNRLLTLPTRVLVWGALCAILILPLLSGVMFETADGTLHLYRLVTLRHALSEGGLWARYVPGMVYGYGAPMFNYYSPLSLYPMLGLNLLGMTPVHAWLIGMAGYVVLATGGMYTLTRRWLSPAGALVAAAAYAAAPYTAYDVLWRGTTSEIASLALLPWVMAAMGALAARPTRWRFAGVTLCVALFMPMHNVITLHGAALLAAFGILLALGTRDKLRTLIRLGAAGVIGALMVAFFWMPAITQTELVKIDGVTAALPEIDVTRNLAPLAESFDSPDAADPARQQPPAAIALGWPTLILGCVGVSALWRGGRRGLALFCAAGVGVLIFMNTPASAVVWRTIPLIRYSQFPTRLIGLASLLLSILAGAGAAWLIRRVSTPLWRGVLYALMLGALLTYAVPYLYRIPTPQTDPRTLVDSHNFERETGYIGTSSFGEYVPQWAKELPDSTALIDRYAQSEVIPRLTPPSGVTITRQEWGLTSAYLSLTADVPTTLVFDWFYLPNWQVWSKGERMEILPNPDDGRLTVYVTAGDHVLDIHWGCIEAECVSEVISTWAVVGLGIIIAGWSLLRPVLGSTVTPTPSLTDAPHLRPFIIAAAVGLSMVGVKIGVIDHIDSPIRYDRFGGGYANGVQTVTEANIHDELTLIGYDVVNTSVAAGHYARYDLIWSARTDIGEDYQIIVKLVTPDGIRIAQVDDLAPAGLGTRNWQTGYYLVDRVDLPIPPDTPPGTYPITAEVFRLSDGQTLPILNAVGNPEGVTVSLGSVDVTLAPPVSAKPMTLQNGANLSLVLPAGMPKTANVGDEIDLRLTWYAERDLTEADSVTLDWMQDAETFVTTDLSASFSYAGWSGQRVYTARHRFYMPGGLEAGVYTPVLRWSDTRYPLEPVTINTPTRRYAVPETMVVQPAAWDNGIRLLGYLVDESGAITLVWQTESPQTQPLRRFAHQIDANGQILSVVDGVPVDWTRPVTGWATSEIILDPVGVLGDGLRLRVGWYSPRDTTRINIGDTDYFDLP